MKSKKTMLICLVAVLALAMMGFGFAKWSDSVKFEGKVATGNVGVNIQALGTNDEGPDPNCGEGDNWEGKDVASCDMWTECGKTVKLHIKNAYPWYAPCFTFRINGLGTVPVKVEDVKLTNWSGELGKFIVMSGWEIHVVNPASHGLPAEDRTINPSKGGYPANWQGLAEALKYIQLHKGGYIDVSVCMYIQEDIYECGKKKTAPQNASSIGKIKIDVAQWNEVGPSPAQ
ncbi:MAG TPA: hypothetical protein GXX59_03065 [Syntrophomonadaceae bacterium]|nr:hypothetical protein [Syntrophomonadaceae bacterium]